MKLLTLSLFFIFITLSKSQHEYSIKRFNCKSFDQKVLKFENCSVTNLGQTKLLTIIMRFNKDLEKPFYLQVIMAKKTASNYFQDYFRTELIEYCGVMDGSKTNPLFKMILDALGSVPVLIHKCPYKSGLLNASNIPLDANKLMAFPLTGVYKTELTFYNKKKDPLALMRFDEDRKSTNVKEMSRYQF